jgi:hypothetical protein
MTDQGTMCRVVCPRLRWGRGSCVRATHQATPATAGRRRAHVSRRLPGARLLHIVELMHLDSAMRPRPERGSTTLLALLDFASRYVEFDEDAWSRLRRRVAASSRLAALFPCRRRDHGSGSHSPASRAACSSDSAIAMRRAASAALRRIGENVSAGELSLRQVTGTPSCFRTAPCATGASKEKCNAGSASRGRS